MTELTIQLSNSEREMLDTICKVENCEPAYAIRILIAEAFEKLNNQRKS